MQVWLFLAFSAASPSRCHVPRAHLLPEPTPRRPRGKRDRQDLRRWAGYGLLQSVCLSSPSRTLFPHSDVALSTWLCLRAFVTLADSVKRLIATPASAYGFRDTGIFTLNRSGVEGAISDGQHGSHGALFCARHDL